MIQENEEMTAGLPPDPIRLPPIVLQPHRLLNDGQEFDSMESLAHYLAVQCITCMLDVIQRRDPLRDPEYSSIVWLRSDGRIELIREKHYRDRSSEDLLSDSLYIEAFRSKADALPVSRYHRCVNDAKGPFVGDIKGRTIFIKPKWDGTRSIAQRDAYAAAASRISLERIRIEALDQQQTVSIIKRCRYRESLKKRIHGWLFTGKYPACLERLSVFALKRESEEAIVQAFGKERFNHILAEKTRQALINDAVA